MFPLISPNERRIGEEHKVEDDVVLPKFLPSTTVQILAVVPITSLLLELLVNVLVDRIEEQAKTLVDLTSTLPELSIYLPLLRETSYMVVEITTAYMANNG